MIVARTRAVAVLAGTSIALSSCSSTPVAEACHSDVVIGEVPAWAHAGFADGSQVPYVVGANGRILAVLFAGTLIAADGPEPVNKVLLVPREPLNGLTPLTIDARLDGTGEAVRRERADGPGPGSLDLPEPGCWRLSLSWGDQTDTLDLEYVAPAS